MKTCIDCGAEVTRKRRKRCDDCHHSYQQNYMREWRRRQLNTPPERYRVKPSGGMKWCYSCQSYKPANEEYFYRVSYGYLTPCMACRKAKSKKPHPPKPLKRCHLCGAIYPRTDEYFHHQKNTSDGLSGICKWCNRWKVKQYRQLKRIKERQP